MYGNLTQNQAWGNYCELPFGNIRASHKIVHYRSLEKSTEPKEKHATLGKPREAYTSLQNLDKSMQHSESLQKPTEPREKHATLGKLTEAYRSLQNLEKSMQPICNLDWCSIGFL